MCEVLCAGFAGMIGRFSVFPLDTIKVVSSVAENSADQRSTFLTAARSVYASDGLFGFYRGLGISLFASAPGVALYIMTYEWSKNFMKDTFPNTPSPLVHLTCGLAAEAVSCIIWVPMDVVKERLQSQHSGIEGRYANSWHGISTLARLEGFSGMYRGYFSTLGSFGPFSAVYFLAFEEAQKFVNSYYPPINMSSNSTSNYSYSSSPAVRTAIAAAMGNVVACVITNPLEVSKTRYQVHRCMLESKEGEGGVKVSSQFRGNISSMWDSLQWSVKNEGWTKLWTRGLFARILFQTPSSAITFGCYNLFKDKYCDKK